MLAAGVAEAVADQVHDALLNHRLRPGGADRLRQALEPVADGDEHVLDAPVLQLGEDLQPEPGAFGAVAGPDPEDVAFSVHGHAHDDVERRVAHLPVADLHHDRIDEEHRIERVQRAGGPLGQLTGDLLGDLRDGVFGDLGPIDLLKVCRDLPGGQAAGREGEHDLINPVQTPLALGHDHRLEGPIPIPWHLNLHRADFGQHGLRPRAVAHVGRDRRLPVVVTEVFGQFGFQGGFQDILRQLVQQPAGPDQAHALLLRLGQQPLGEVLLIDDLSRHRVDHRACHLGRGV